MALSAATYSTILRLSTAQRHRIKATKVAEAAKIIASLHAIATTVAALYALRSSQWTIPESRSRRRSKPPPNGYFPSVGPFKSQSELDDSANPLITGQCSYSNALTAWEAGYLFYDTYAMVYEAYIARPNGGARRALLRVAKQSPLLFGHHLVLFVLLSYLQTYIAAGREVGIWVITSFILMNASNPVVHARWWIRRWTGRSDFRLDIALIVAFAAARFGTLAWVLKKYGQYHGLGPWEAFTKLRIACKMGTAALIGVNGLWWVIQVIKIIKGELAKR
jgi:hypothetical protein